MKRKNIYILIGIVSIGALSFFGRNVYLRRTKGSILSDARIKDLLKTAYATRLENEKKEYLSNLQTRYSGMSDTPISELNDRQINVTTPDWVASWIIDMKSTTSENMTLKEAIAHVYDWVMMDLNWNVLQSRYIQYPHAYFGDLETVKGADKKINETLLREYLNEKFNLPL